MKLDVNKKFLVHQPHYSAYRITIKEPTYHLLVTITIACPLMV